MPKAHPIAVGDRVRVDIESLAMGGDGVAHVDNFVVFVAGAVPGDHALVKVDQVKATYGRAHVLQVLAPGPGRATPPCPVYEQCGGCQLMHLDYQRQLEWKRQFVIDSLVRIGRFEEPEVAPVIGMDHPWAYRNKAQFPTTASGHDVVFGFYARGSHDVVPTDTCDVQDPLIMELLGEVHGAAREFAWTAYDEQRHQGLLRHVMIRVSGAAEQHSSDAHDHPREALVILIIAGDQLPHEDEAAGRLMAHPAVVGVVKNVNRARTNRILGDHEEALAGRPYLVVHMDGLQFRVSASSFYQVNPVQTAVLYDRALSSMQLSADDRVLDVYCGIGTISLLAAQRARAVTGVEVVEAAARDARLNAELNGIENAEFVSGKAEDVLPQLAKQGLTYEVIVVDPPRKGCEPEVLEAMAAMEAQRIVYISCNPTTLARDLRQLADAGYCVGQVQPVDMFPHTTHVESIILMTNSRLRGKLR